ncbi:MAG: hypothetical protein NUV65_03880 [Candidatus Roizmanbacteria bacterium]|nr:hypothetical protein [Candidatus Roizmanbacteria bacterium]
MTTIVNSTTPATDSGGTNFLIGAFIVLGFIGILIFFGIPAIKRMGVFQINVPTPQVVVPNKIDVNVQQTK